LGVNSGESYSRGASLDIPRSVPGPQNQAHLQPEEQPERFGSRSTTPKLRPVSMGPLSPPRSPPLVTVDSPGSPPKHTSNARSPFVSAQPSRESLRRNAPSRPTSPTSGLARPFKIPSRAATPALDTRHVPNFAASQQQATTTDPQKPPSPGRDSPIYASPISHVPPPINRAGKPKVFSKPNTLPLRQVSDSLAPSSASDRGDERISPFSTPPSEHESIEEEGSPSPPRVPEHTKPKVNTSRPTREGYFAPPPLRYGNMDSPLEPSSAVSEPNWTDKMKFGIRICKHRPSRCHSIQGCSARPFE